MNNPWDGLYKAMYQSQKPATLNEAIRKFLSSLELTDRQQAMVQKRQQAVRQRLDSRASFYIKRDFLIGSYARETQIRSLDGNTILTSQTVLDVDAIVLLNYNDENARKYWHLNDGGAAILRDLHRAINGHPGALSVEVDRPSVTIKWSDLKMEVTPAFLHPDGGLFIPAMNDYGAWQHSDPEGDASALTAGNKDCNGELIPMIKMLKCWNRSWCKSFRSFAIESAAYRSARTSYSGYGFELPHFFKQMQSWAGTSIMPPSGKGGSIYMPTSPEILKLLKLSHNCVENAFKAASTGHHEEAINMMGLAFGKPFPGAS